VLRNSSIFRVTFSIPLRQPGHCFDIFPKMAILSFQRSFYRVSVNLFPSLNQPQQLENVVVTGPNRALIPTSFALVVIILIFTLNHSDGRAIFGILHLSIYLQTNFPSASFGSNNVSIYALQYFTAKFSSAYRFELAHLYNPVITVVSTGLTQVFFNVISLVSIGDSESSQSLVSCNVSDVIDAPRFTCWDYLL